MMNDTANARAAVRTIARSQTSFRDRLIETYPALFSWLVLLAPVWLTLVHPAAGVAFILLATGVFLIRVCWYGFGSLMNRTPILAASETDWGEKLSKQEGWQDYHVILMIRAFREGNRDMLEASIQSFVDSQW